MSIKDNHEIAIVIIAPIAVCAMALGFILVHQLGKDEQRITELEQSQCVTKEHAQHADVKFAACVKQLGHRSEQ